jgi:general secretion pathway protein A
VEYVEARMARAGVPNQHIFQRELLREIHVRAHGIPRLINAVCDNLLVTAFAMEQKTANLEMLDEVSRDLRLDWATHRDRRGRSRFSPEEEHLPESSFLLPGD